MLKMPLTGSRIIIMIAEGEAWRLGMCNDFKPQLVSFPPEN